jgi:hypothetical protein
MICAHHCIRGREACGPFRRSRGQASDATWWSSLLLGNFDPNSFGMLGRIEATDPRAGEKPPWPKSIGPFGHIGGV